MVKTNPTLIGPDCRIKLNTKRSIDLNFTGIVYPRNPKLYNSFGFDHAFNDGMLFDPWILFNEEVNRGQDLFNRLKKFRLILITLR